MISRRLFLDLSVGAFAVCGTQPAILDLQRNCGLPESIRGFQRALPGARVTRQLTGREKFVIVPGAMTLNATALRQLHRCAAAGGAIVLEAALAFGNNSNFKQQQDVLSREFGLAIDAPVDLWRQSGAAGLPYIEYREPLALHVRDFSYAIPVRAPAARTLATVHGFSVAAKRPFRNGQITFLGSPLGPVLLAGERQGARWIEALVQSAFSLTW